MEGSLETTNVLLGIMAAVSVLEGLLIIGIGVGAWMAYRRVMTLVNGIEERQIAPAMVKVNGILDEVRVVANHVRADTERVEHAIRQTMHRVDDTAHRVRSDVRTKTSWMVGALRGLRVALQGMLQTEPGRPAHDRNDTAQVRTH